MTAALATPFTGIFISLLVYLVGCGFLRLVKAFSYLHRYWWELF